MIAKHYEQARNYAEAEKYFVQPVSSEAVDMYASANHWEVVHRIAVDNRRRSRVLCEESSSSTTQSSRAEKMYGEQVPELAIEMYKRKTCSSR